jgi:hypothetical protein
MRVVVIYLKKLSDAFKGKWVVYSPHSKREIGRLKSWSEHGVFVVYNCGDDWDDFENYTAALTPAKDLTIISPDSLACKHGHSAKGIRDSRRKKYYVDCNTCKTVKVYKNHKEATRDFYKTVIGKSRIFIEMVKHCSCGEPLFHDFKYEICKSCKTVKRRYR